VIGDNSSSSSSQSRLPPGGPVLNGGSISSASDSSSWEVYGEVSPRDRRGTKPGNNHGSGANAFKEESYKDSEEGMWGERPLACGSHRRPVEEDGSASQSRLTKRLPGLAPAPSLLRLEQYVPMNTNTQVTRMWGKHFDGGRGILIGERYAISCAS
jgi:hypothetical protein